MSSFLTKQIQLFPEQANVYEGFLNLHKKKYVECYNIYIFFFIYLIYFLLP